MDNFSISFILLIVADLMLFHNNEFKYRSFQLSKDLFLCGTAQLAIPSSAKSAHRSLNYNKLKVLAVPYIPSQK